MPRHNLEDLNCDAVLSLVSDSSDSTREIRIQSLVTFSRVIKKIESNIVTRDYFYKYKLMISISTYMV